MAAFLTSNYLEKRVFFFSLWVSVNLELSKVLVEILVLAY